VSEVGTSKKLIAHGVAVDATCVAVDGTTVRVRDGVAVKVGRVPVEVGVGVCVVILLQPKLLVRVIV
jgi:hypothetical protein